MAAVTGRAVVGITGNSIVLVVDLVLVAVLMTIDATEDLVIACICMAVGTKRPCSGMLPRIDREILGIMVKRGRTPGSGGVTHLAISRKLRRGVGRIVGLNIIILMTTNTGIRDRSVIPVMALLAARIDMCAGEGPVVIMDCKCGRRPSRVRGMAVCTGGRNISSLVRRICAAVVICLVTTHTGIRSSGIIPVMTAVAACGGMPAGEGIVSIMDRKCGRLPSGGCSMAVCTGRRES